MANNQVYWRGTPPAKCQYPGCDHALICTFVDGRTDMGPWGCLCTNCHLLHGFDLGAGRGQLYERQPDGRWLKTAG